MALQIAHDGMFSMICIDGSIAMKTQQDTRTAYVGGFGDCRNKFVRRMFEAYGKNGDLYFEHYQERALAEWIDESNSNYSITVIGHSYGGNSAARVVANGYRVHRLITVDPVGRFKPNFKNVAKYSAVWTNYVATGGGINRNNLIARMGGWYGHRPKQYASHHICVDKDHVDICFQCCRPLFDGDYN